MAYDIPPMGRITQVDIRDVWKSEPYNFTPWLAESDNLQFLADGLELPGLELVRTEHPVDSFSADIVCRIVDSEHYVLIENQLERTDHIHLGQVLTYAPRFDAKIIVWVARQFTDAHRAALDWLNRITAENYAFFGVEVRAVKIGESLPAPMFDVVVKPNDWSKLTTGDGAMTSEASDYQTSNMEFWQFFEPDLSAAGGLVRRVNKPLKEANYYGPISTNGRAYVAAWRTQSRKPHVGAYVGIYGANAKLVWKHLLTQKDKLDQDFGEPLDWSVNPQETVFKIYTDQFYSPADKQYWAEQRKWLVERMVRLRKVFEAPVLQAIADADAETEVQD